MSSPKLPPQSETFKRAARKLDCDEDDAQFGEK